jgi:hypothetical protein
MGQHYITQYYLSGFSQITNPSFLWVYEKGSRSIRSLPINKIAQEKRFYSDEMESYLAIKIEAPANEVLRKIRDLKPIALKEKSILSEYIAVLWKRVPRAKQRFRAIAPKISNDLKQDINLKLDELKRKYPNESELLEKRRIEAQDFLDEFKDKPGKDVWLNVIPPEMTPRITEALNQMKWVFLVCDEPITFLTNDNPVFIHESFGIGKKYSELTFPISSHITLWATWWNVDREYIDSDNQVIKEINRRVACSATRFVFCSKKRDWIVTLVNKQKHHLHIITP